jgi:hypothetical protein
VEDHEEDLRGRIGGLPGDHYHSSGGAPEIDSLHRGAVVWQTYLWAHNPKVAGSNPAPATNKFKGFCGGFGPRKPFFCARLAVSHVSNVSHALQGSQ